MAVSETSPATRLKALEAARIRAKKELGRGETLTSRPMAALLGVSWNTLRKWTQEIDGFAQSGAFEIGGQGVDYVFKPMKTIDWLITYFRRERAKRVEKAGRARRLIAGSRLDHVPEEYGLAEIRGLLDASIKFQDAKVASGELVRRDDVLAELRVMFPLMLQAGLTAPQRADPNGMWSEHEREIAETVARMILSAQEKVVQKGLNKLSGGAAKSG